MIKIEFSQPKPRIEDWRVKMNGRTVGDVWRAGDGYLVSVSRKEPAATLDAAFKAARKQIVEVQGPGAASSRSVPCNDGLAGAAEKHK